MVRSFLTILAASVIGAPALAQSADPAIGHRLATSVCSACHAVGDDPAAQSPVAAAPRFVAIGRMPSMNERAITVFLRTSHAPMPNIMLSAEERDSVAAYILSLGGK
jgi:mono/diheme cytochrome c family protein